MEKKVKIKVKLYLNEIIFQVYASLDGAVNQVSVGTTMKRMLKDALSFS